MSHEILINATKVSHDLSVELYEFILDDTLNIVECVRVEDLFEGMVEAVDNYHQNLSGVLFELNHVRVNPRIDNTIIINTLIESFQDIGVDVYDTPTSDELGVCYKPLGEISANIRFYFYGDSRCVFLSPESRPKMVAVN